MKLCPTCNNSFEDTLSFCPRDGEVLHESPENLVGQSLDGKYELESFIAQGGMGAVYRARHILLGDIVVIKMLRPEMRQNAEWLRRFQREGRAARSFRHPNAVTVYDLSAATDGHIYMVMEFVEGHTLEKELRTRGRFTPLEALEVIEPIADALNAAHTRGVVHRDMKPENVMLGEETDGDRVIKLLDLGIAKMVGVADAMAGEATSLTVAGQILGTPYYMSPEQWGEPQRDGNPEIDGRTDIYSLGVIFFELVAGRKPVGGRTLSELRQEHLRETPPDLAQFAPDAPAAFVRAVAHAMAKDRNDRPQTANELINEVRASLGLPPRGRGRSVKGDIHSTTEPTNVATSAGQRGSTGTEAPTASLASLQPVGESGRAETVLTADLEALPDALTGRGSSAPPSPVTSANVGVRGDGARMTAAARPGIETGAATAPVVGERDRTDHHAVESHTVRPGRSFVPIIAGGALALLLVASVGGWLAWKLFIAKPVDDPIVKEGPAKPTPAAPPVAPRVETMSYWIEAFDEPQKGDVRRVAEVSAPLTSGQSFKFHFTSRERGYLYLIGPGEKGNAMMTFLTAQGGGLLKTNLVAANSDFAFPFGEDKVLILDNNPGTEEYTAIFSQTPLLTPAFLVEKNLKELSPAEVKELEDLRAQLKTVAPALDVNQGSGERRVVVSAPEDALARPIIFDIRIAHQ
jgi:serine/threonine-protein kinase